MGNTIRVLQINSCNFGSTGNIMLNISEKADEKGYVSYVAYANSRSNKLKEVKNSILIGTRLERNMHLQLSYFTGYNGCFSVFGTKKFLEQIDNAKPVIIHLHNLHNCYINLRLLFEYIKERDIQVVWTLHDCWAFTGQCPHYIIANCDKWKSGCYDCPQYRQYPASRVDKTKKMYKFKKDWFTGVKDLTLVTPSEWLKSQVEKSFLSEYPIQVINNGIDLSVFKPIQSDFREKYDLDDKIILLGVANSWSANKGLNVFIGLSKLLEKRYKIVLVGLSIKQIEKLPESILGIQNTKNQIELAKLYSTADYFLNPSLEETMGLVTIEALACGTPVVVSNSTAVPEVVTENCGVIVNGNSIEEYYNVITNLEKDFLSSDCIEQAKKYDKEVKYEEYIKLYKQLIEKTKRK